jgi:hypothetical protein
VDDYCVLAGTDTNFPYTNQFSIPGATPPDIVAEIPFIQEVTDTRWMVVCFIEPIFNADYPLMEES